MSYRDKYSSSESSRRHGSSRRDSSPSRHRSRRTPSPGPSRGRSSPKRDPKVLPESFGRVQESMVDDDLNILQRMKTSYVNSPLHDLYDCVKDEKKVKIWTRNYKEVRGILTGYVIAFDKHWNLILRDVDEVYLKPKKSKTPFLRDLESNENLPEMTPKVPRERRPPTDAPLQPKIEPKSEEEGDKKKKRKKKRGKNTSEKRAVEKLFVRGDNIVMICPLDEETEPEEEEEETEPVTKTE